MSSNEKSPRTFAFTVPKLNALPVPDRPPADKRHLGLVEYFDTKERGLSLRVSYSGIKNFYAEAINKDTGKRKTKKLDAFSATGAGDGITLVDARTAAQAFKGEYAGRRDVVAIIRGEKDDRADAPTVNEIIDKYLELHVANLKSRKAITDALIGSKKYRNTGEGHDVVRDTLGNMLFRDVKRKHIVAMIDAHTKRGHHAMANNVNQMVSHMWSWAVLRGADEAVEFSVAHKIPQQPKNVRKRYLSANEVANVWGVLDEKCVADVALIYRIMAVTGLRVNSVVTMRWQDLDFSSGEWRIQGEFMKNGHEFVVPMSTMFIDIMRDKTKARATGDDVWVFPTGGYRGKVSKTGHRVRSSFANRHREVVEAAGVEYFSYHDFRRTVDTNMGKLGITRFDRDRVLAHVDSSVGGRHYDKYDYYDEKYRALEAWSYKLYWLTGQVPPSALVAKLKKWGFTEKWEEKPWNLQQWDRAGHGNNIVALPSAVK